MTELDPPFIRRKLPQAADSTIDALKKCAPSPSGFVPRSLSAFLNASSAFFLERAFQAEIF